MASVWLLLLVFATPLPAQQLRGTAAEFHQALQRVQLDEPFSFRVTDLRLRRQAVRLTLNHGTLVFLEAAGGRVTGAVFEGSGQALVMPPTTVERKQLARHTGSPILSANFTSAYFRFTDDTFAEWMREIRAGRGRPRHDAETIQRWRPHLDAFNRSHSARLLMDLLEPGTGNYFYVRLLSKGLGWFDLVVDERRDESVLIGQVTTLGGASRFSIWSSFSPEGRPAPRPPARGRRYRIHTTIHPDTSLEGICDVEVEVREPGPRLLRFHLSRFLKVSSVEQNGEPIEFFQNAGLQGDEVVNRGNDQVLVVLTRPLAEHETMQLEFRYRGNVITDLGNGVLYVGARGQWYPTLYDTRPAEFEMTFRYPGRLKLVATGEQTRSRAEGSWREETWAAEVPVTLAGFNLGDYDTRSLETKNYRIEVFANRALEPQLSRRHGDNAGGEPGGALSGTTGGDGSPPSASPSDLLDQVATDVADALEFFSEIFEPYPHRRLHVSQIPAHFGQGFPGLIYLPTYTFLPAGEQQRLGLSASAQRFYSQLMPAHETAHQWWGTWIPPETYRDQWLSEALATYSGLLYFERQRENPALNRAWLRQFRDDLLRENAEGVPLDEAGPLVLGPRLDTPSHPNGRVGLIYTKGPWVIHMLREVLRDPGTGSDRVFLDGLRELTRRPIGEPLSVAQFQRVFEARLPEWADLEDNGRLDWFFEQWVRDTGIPRYEFEWKIQEVDGGLRAAGRIRQREVSGLFTMPVPVYLRYGSRLEFLTRVVVTGQETAFSLPVAERPDEILLDPENTILRRPNRK